MTATHAHEHDTHEHPHAHAGQPATLAEALPRFEEIFAALAEGAGERDLSGEHPYALVQALADAGFGRLRVPVEFGGFDVDLPTLFDLLARAAQADSNVTQIWRGHFTTTEILRAELDQEVRSHWLTQIGRGLVFGNAQSEEAPATVSETGGFSSISTRVTVGPDGRRYVSGRKFYSTGARFADVIRAGVVGDNGELSFVVLPARHPGVEHVDDWDGVGQRQTGSGTTVFTEVPVTEPGSIGRFRESLGGLDSFVQIVHLANLAGIARSIVAETVALVRSRTRTSLHGLTQVATEDPDVLGVVGTLRVRELTADVLLRYAAQTLEDAHAVGTDEAFTHAYRETSAAQVAVIEAVLDAASTAFNAGGSSAARSRVHLDRHWRNARTLASHNPVIYKPRILGDFLVNGSSPTSTYYRNRPSAQAGADDVEPSAYERTAP